MERRGEEIIESSVEARQRLLGRPELVVLVVSCILAVAGLALPYAGGSPRLVSVAKLVDFEPEQVSCADLIDIIVLPRG
jgi:hypothetical protein